MMTSEEKGIHERLLELADETAKCQDKLRRLGLYVSASRLSVPIRRIRDVAKDNLALRESVDVMDVVAGKVMKALADKGGGR